MITRRDKTQELVFWEKLDFEENYESTVSLFRFVRTASRGFFTLRKLHFDLITDISPAAALVLASEVDRWGQQISGKLTANIESWNEEIKRLLCEMGYFELLGLDKPPAVAQSEGITFLSFRRGTSEPSDIGKLAKQLRIDIEAIVGTEIKKHEFFQGLSEAMVNVGQHAYPSAAKEHSSKQWWQSASFDKRDRTLTVMFYDQGIGIPKSLPPDGLIERIRAKFPGFSDSVKIKIAMKYGRSSTHRNERGKGLHDLIKFAKAYPGGRLSIYSGNGLYRIQHTNDDKIRVSLRDHSGYIGGTLIEWSVKL